MDTPMTCSNIEKSSPSTDLSLCSGFLLVVITSGEGQKTNCSIDPDLISFEDKDLEAVMKSLYGSGNCSAVVWKKEVVNVLTKHRKEILDMSTRDKTMLRYLISFVVKPEAERPPPDYFLWLGTLSESEIMNPLDFGPSSDSPSEPEEDYISPIFWKFGNSDEETDSTTVATRRKRHLQRSPDVFRPSLTDESPRSQQPEKFSFDGAFERSPRIIGNTPNRHDEMESSKFHPPDSRGVFDFGKEVQQNQRGHFNYERPEDLFSPNRQPKQKWNNDFIRPFTQQKPGPENSWVNSQRNPVEYSPNRPRPQGRPVGGFSRPPAEASGNSFKPDNQRRPPFNVDGSLRPQRPQLGDTDVIMPDDQRPLMRETQEPPQRNPVEYNPNRPRPQGRPSGSFSRPAAEASGNSFTPDNQRRPPFNVDGSFRPQRPQLGDTDVTTNQVRTERPLGTTTASGPQPWATPPSLCVRNCPTTPEYNPVCGSDRVTYNNPGHLHCEQQCGKGKTDFISISLYN